jgi:hypothetical protein
VWLFEGQTGQAMWRYTAIAALTVQDFDGRTIARPLSHSIAALSHSIAAPVTPDRRRVTIRSSASGPIAFPQSAAFVPDHTLCSRARRVLVLAREDPRPATYVLCRLSTQ